MNEALGNDAGGFGHIPMTYYTILPVMLDVFFIYLLRHLQ